MRTFEEILADQHAALRIEDAQALHVLAEEMLALDTPRATASASHVLGAAAGIAGMYSSALEHYGLALALYEELDDRAGMARVTGNMGNVFLRIGDYPSAQEHNRQAMALHQELGNNAGVARITNDMGVVGLYTGDYRTALEHFRRAMALYEELVDRAGVARVANNIGNLHLKTGDYPLALESYRSVLAMYEALRDRAGLAAVTNNIGSVYQSTGDYPSALEHFRRALAMREELGDRSGAAGVTNNLGNVYQDTGDYPSALEYFRRALAIHEEQGDRARTATVVGNIGNVLARTGSNAAALEHLSRARELYEMLGEHAGAARVTGNIGSMYAVMGENALALEHLSRAITLHHELGDRAGVSHFTGNKISVLLKLERYDEATEQLEQQAVMLMDDPAVRSKHLANYAFLAEHRGDHDAAHHQLIEALSNATQAGLRAEAAQYHETLRNLAQKRNDFAGYIEHNNEFIRLTEAVHGKETTQRMAMMEAERRMEGERREREKERALLYGALPKSVADRMIRGEDVSGDHFDHAAVMFLDIVGFTSHTSTMPPSDVVKMLENIFRMIDSACNAHSVIKVKTIGDSYMCFRGDADAATNASSVAHVALNVMQHAFTWPNSEPLQFRIGMHIGPATAGVIGTERLQYDVWGDTVNVASRMESSGEAGRVHVTEAFASELKRNTEYTIQNSITESRNQGSHEVPLVTRNSSLVTSPRGLVEVKGKGQMMTYWIETQESVH